MHPSDLETLGLAAGDIIELVSGHGQVKAVAGSDDAVEPGVVSIAHGWGALPGDDNDPVTTGSAVNALIDADRNYEPINSMPYMSALPIYIRRAS